MVNINLLPWRDYLKTYQRKKIIQILLMTLLLIFLLFYCVRSIIDFEFERLLLMKLSLKQKFAQQTSNLNYKNHKHQPILTHSMIEAARASLVNTENLMNYLGHHPISGVCFKQIARVETTLMFVGYANSVADLTEYLLALRKTQLFLTLKMDVMKQQGNGVISFKFLANERSLSEQHTQTALST